ncbi:Uncharacterised protein [Chryseobacterium nakagawai]|nr:Uncharacterised protein [Chryseobacterium nakagawai]
MEEMLLYVNRDQELVVIKQKMGFLPIGAAYQKNTNVDCMDL